MLEWYLGLILQQIIVIAPAPILGGSWRMEAVELVPVHLAYLYMYILCTHNVQMNDPFFIFLASFPPVCPRWSLKPRVEVTTVGCVTQLREGGKVDLLCRADEGLVRYVRGLL